MTGPAADFDIQRIVDADDDRVAGLLTASDRYFASLYPPESIHTETLDVLVGPHAAFFAAFSDGTAAACGALKLIEDDRAYGEVKRLFVAREFRRRNLATEIMRRLETFALDNGVSVIRLETGTLQPEALQLYRGLGYEQRQPFGSYAPDPLSVFFEKFL